MPSMLAAQDQVTVYFIVVARAALSLVLLVAVFAPLEQLFSVRKVRLFYPGWSVNLGWYFVNAVAAAILLGPRLSTLIAWGAHTLVPASVTGAAASLPLGLRIPAAMIVGEIGFYWGHRWSHEFPLLWRFHAVHHSAAPFELSWSTRAHTRWTWCLPGCAD